MYVPERFRNDTFQTDDITMGRVAPVHAICFGCVAVGTEKSTYTSLVKVSFSARLTSACALQPVLQRHSRHSRLCRRVRSDQHEISGVKGNFRVVHVRDGDVGDEIGVAWRRRQREPVHAVLVCFDVKRNPCAAWFKPLVRSNTFPLVHLNTFGIRKTARFKLRFPGQQQSELPARKVIYHVTATPPCLPMIVPRQGFL